jgi:hypothetical protein
VVLVSTTPARPGFDAVYQLIYKNKGNQTLSGTVSFAYDDLTLDFVSSTVIPSNQATGLLGYNFSGLLPFETRTFSIVLNVNSPTETPAVNIGDTLVFTATINPISGDEMPGDNVFDFPQTVVGSFDPNDKTCMEGTVVSPTLIGNYLHYVINFENTGTFAAENVVIKDLIDTDKFDINSVQVLSASHSGTPVITGNKLEFIFQDIDLAPNQYGYVAYKIKTKSNLPVGTTVTNKANIYFDFNFPVETNIASTTFQNLGVGENMFARSVAVYPNPAGHIVNVKSGNTIQSISVFDIQGRLVAIHPIDENQANLDISAFADGIYYLRIVTDKGTTTQKIIKK